MAEPQALEETSLHRHHVSEFEAIADCDVEQEVVAVCCGEGRTRRLVEARQRNGSCGGVVGDLDNHCETAASGRGQRKRPAVDDVAHIAASAGWRVSPSAFGPIVHRSRRDASSARLVCVL